jgi:hypothetical protein
MPTYADNYTFRVRGSYISCGIPHKMKCRGEIGAAGFSEASALANAMSEYVDNFSSRLPTDWAWTGWEYANEDSDVWIPFSPVLAAEPTGVISTGGLSSMMKIRAVCHQGRAAGSRARIYWWGPIHESDDVADPGANGIYTSAELSGLAASTTLATDTFKAGNGLDAIFYERLTVKENDRLLRNVRRGLY